MNIEECAILLMLIDCSDPVRDIVYNSVHILPITTIGSKVTRPVAGSVGISIGINIKSEIKEYEY
jgi:hypothetical protein